MFEPNCYNLALHVNQLLWLNQQIMVKIFGLINNLYNLKDDGIVTLAHRAGIVALPFLRPELWQQPLGSKTFPWLPIVQMS